MHLSLAGARVVLAPRFLARARPPSDPVACSWDALRAVYQEQAARGIPEAVRGLELMRQDRWPSSGRPRGR